MVELTRTQLDILVRLNDYPEPVMEMGEEWYGETSGFHFNKMSFEKLVRWDLIRKHNGGIWPKRWFITEKGKKRAEDEKSDMARRISGEREDDAGDSAREQTHST